MSMAIPGRGAVRFAEFVFHHNTGDLIGPRGSSRLQPQPAKVLAALLGRPGELVTRDELKQILWPNTHVEADQGLNFCVRQIRVALGDDADRGRIIETLPRRGYRLVVPVERGEVDPAAADAPQSHEAAQGAELPQPSAARPRVRREVLLGIATIVVASVAILWNTRGGGAGTPTGQTRVAIIPLVAPANEPWMNELNQAITEQLVTRIATMDGRRFGVIGPATTARFAGNVTRPQTEIAAELGAPLIISGGIRRSDSTLFFQVIRATDGVHAFVWHERVWNRSSAAVVEAILSGLRPKLIEEADRLTRK